jgi:hypothetical protein
VLAVPGQAEDVPAADVDPGQGDIRVGASTSCSAISGITTPWTRPVIGPIGEGIHARSPSSPNSYVYLLA